MVLTVDSLSTTVDNCRPFPGFGPLEFAALGGVVDKKQTVTTGLTWFLVTTGYVTDFTDRYCRQLPVGMILQFHRFLSPASLSRSRMVRRVCVWEQPRKILPGLGFTVWGKCIIDAIKY